MSGVTLFLLALVIVTAVFWPERGLLSMWRRREEYRGRTQLEDALKHVLAWQHRSKVATPESIAGALSLPPQAVLKLVNKMQSAELVESVSGGFRLTSKGESWALQVVRAHRLWERYLSDDANMPLARLHQAAERAEHHLSGEVVAKLDAHLGHPQHDPHGDPIPTAEGELTPLDATSLTEWPIGERARIVHLEDEPDVIFQQIVAAGLRPGQTIRILESDGRRIVVSDGEREHRLAPAVAANIQVAPAAAQAVRAIDAIRLSQLKQGVQAKVIELDAACRGFSRRRLLDLGLTPNTKVEVSLENTFGDPRAFRIRGTTIALRNAQSDHIWVCPITLDQPLEAAV